MISVGSHPQKSNARGADRAAPPARGRPVHATDPRIDPRDFDPANGWGIDDELDRRKVATKYPWLLASLFPDDEADEGERVARELELPRAPRALSQADKAKVLLWALDILRTCQADPEFASNLAAFVASVGQGGRQS